MKISGGLMKLLVTLAPVILGLFKIDLPEGLLETILNWISGNFQASALIGGGAGFGLYSLYGSTPKPKWQAEAVANGAAEYCPQTGAFQWKGEDAA